MPPKRAPPAVEAKASVDETADQPVTKKSRSEPVKKAPAKSGGAKAAAAAPATTAAKKANAKSGAVAAAPAPAAAKSVTAVKAEEEDEGPLGPGHASNKAVIGAFLHLAVYEHKFGDKYAALGCLKVHEKLRRHVPDKIDPTTASKSLPSECHVGRGARAQIDELYGITTCATLTVTAGQIIRLEELKAAANGVPVPELDGAHNDDLEKLIVEIKATQVEGKLLSKDTLKKIEDAKATFMAMKVVDLKNVLRTNQQQTSGVKDDLSERCAQGSVLGAFRRCPHCHGGKLRFEKEKGLYFCHGFMDDDEYKPCYFHANTCAVDDWM